MYILLVHFSKSLTLLFNLNHEPSFLTWPILTPLYPPPILSGCVAAERGGSKVATQGQSVLTNYGRMALLC